MTTSLLKDVLAENQKRRVRTFTWDLIISLQNTSKQVEVYKRFFRQKGCIEGLILTFEYRLKHQVSVFEIIKPSLSLILVTLCIEFQEVWTDWTLEQPRHLVLDGDTLQTSLILTSVLHPVLFQRPHYSLKSRLEYFWAIIAGWLKSLQTVYRLNV